MQFTNLLVTDWSAEFAAAVPVLFALAAAITHGARSGALRWRTAEIVSGATLLLSLLSLAGVAINGHAVASGSASHLTRTDLIGSLMLSLVTFIGWIIVRYSRQYLCGDAAERAYAPALCGTLAAVSVVVISNHLVLLALAWLATSLTLHRLLTLYSDRRGALIAAHKKFLASRLADLALAGAILLMVRSLGTLRLDEIAARVAAMGTLPASLQVAAALLALTAVLKCAQLPIHGWLIQVMEAPTPVSALLHAGVVNIGGFVLIRLAELIGAAPGAQGLLVTIGGATAILAALVTSTRISIKVALAWSTCAQMGFMLMQIGLGLYALALLHLVAHSLYKAYAFLSAGGAVEQVRIARMAGPAPAAGIAHRFAAAAAGLGVIALAHAVWPAPTDQRPGLWVLTLIAGLALTPLVAAGPSGTARARLRAPLFAFAIAAAYVVVHALAATALALPEPAHPASSLPWVVALGFAALFALQQVVAARPAGALAARLHPWFYAGFYLDEIFTRLTFRVWPVRLPRSGAVAPLAFVANSGEIR